MNPKAWRRIPLKWHIDDTYGLRQNWGAHVAGTLGMEPTEIHIKHPFLGHAQELPFASAHNGILYHDHILRYNLRLASAKIRTNSYIAVQLIEQKKVVNFNSFRDMAELVGGSFPFKVLNAQNNLYIIKDDNPRQFTRCGTRSTISKEKPFSRWAAGVATTLTAIF